MDKEKKPNHKKDDDVEIIIPLSSPHGMGAKPEKLTDHPKVRKAGKKTATLATLAAALAFTIMTVVGVSHDVFTVPQHTITYADSLVMSVPAVVTAAMANEIFRGKKVR